MKKKLMSLLLSFAMGLNTIAVMPINAFAVSGDSKIYEKEGYRITYSVGSEWDNNQTIEVKIENTGDEPILNWALKYDIDGTLSNVWNSKVFGSVDEYTVMKNNGYNYEIEPGQSVNYGYTLTSKTEEPAELPDDIEMYNRRIDVKSGFEAEFNVTSDWYTGFQAEVSIKNTSLEPIEAWTLSFDGNFDINNIWNAKLIANENRNYKVANQLWTTPINPGESASFGFTADKSATENATADDFQLTAVVIGESSLEKEPVIDYELDTDKDGLPDYYEEILGTDKNNTDTDSDGLSDGYEVFYLGTDPLKADSDDNGVNDGEEDFDNDGLTNAEESELGTNPNCADTDGDGLNDGDEVNTHSTNPLKYDSDEDGISDGDEIALGLDPNSSSTDGTPDSERTFAQTIDSESEVLSVINDDESVPFDVSLEIEAAGVAKNNVYARESGYSNAIENSAIVGVAPEFVYTDGLTVEKVTVKFELDDSVADNTLGIYANDSYEFKGIKRLNVFMFFEDVNMLLPIETFHDEATNTVYTTTDRMGTYCLIDMEIFLDNLDKQLNVNEESEAEIEMQPEESGAMSKNSNEAEGYACCTVNKSDAKAKAEDDFDAVFMIDCRSVLSAGEYALIQKSIIEASDTIFIKSPNARVRIVIMNSIGGGSSYRVMKLSDIKSIEPSKDNSFFTNMDDVYSVLSKLPEMTEGGNDCNLTGALSNVCEYAKAVRRKTFCFCYFKAKDTVYQVANVDSYDILHDIKDNSRDINISAICDNNAKGIKYGYAIDMCNMTKGFFTDGYDNSSDYVLSHIYADDGNVENGYKAIIATGYKTVVLNNSLQENYDWYQNSSRYEPYRDTDYDGLADFEEIMFTNEKGYSLIDDNDPCHVKLRSFYDILNIVGDKLFYVKNGLERYKQITGEDGKYPMSLLNVPILPIKSDPTSEDGDNDGKYDSNDGNPLSEMIILSQMVYNDNGVNDENKDDIESVILDADSKINFEYEQKMVIDFSWFYNDPNEYNNELALSSIIMAGLAYHTTAVEDGAVSDRVSKYESEYCYAIKDSTGSRPKILKEIMGEYGFENCKTINLRNCKDDIGNYYNDNHYIQFDIGHKDISDYAPANDTNKTNLLAIFVRGTHGTEEWYSNFDIGNTDEWQEGTDWNTKENHMGFDMAAYRALKEVYIYMEKNNLNCHNTIVWVTGHSRGAAVAGILSKYLIDGEEITINNDFTYGGTPYIVFDYNFATPKQVEVFENSSINYNSYTSIYNVINKSDLVPFLPLKDWGFENYGVLSPSGETQLTSAEKKIWANKVGSIYNSADIALKETTKAFGKISDSRNGCYYYKHDYKGDIHPKTIKKCYDSEINIFKNLPDNIKKHIDYSNYRYIYRYDVTKQADVLVTEYSVYQKPIFFMQLLAGVAASDKQYDLFRFVMQNYSASYYSSSSYTFLVFAVGSGMMEPHFVDTYIVICEQ